MLHISIEHDPKAGDGRHTQKKPRKSSKIPVQKITRKQFFQRIGGIVLLPFTGVWYSMVERTKLRDRLLRKIKIPADIPEGVSFHDSVIVSKKGDKVEVFSSTCTHLGCRINKLEDGRLTCPCHGSQFAEDGSVLRGPANKSLKELPFEINPKTGEITVDVLA